MGEIRTFWALELADAARRQAARLGEALAAAPGGGDVRWMGEESLHVTLRFLGPTDPARVPDLARAVAAATRHLAPFSLALGAPRVFPSPRRPRVVALELEPEAPLAALAAAVERGAVAAGFPAEPRPYRPHLTLGRARRGRRPRLGPLEAVTGSVTGPGQAWEVVDTVLFRSELATGAGRGPRYTPLERVPLTGTPVDSHTAGTPGGPLHPRTHNTRTKGTT